MHPIEWFGFIWLIVALATLVGVSIYLLIEVLLRGG